MICENCGKEHNGEYGSGRFCSCKCARSFSSKEKKKEINEKVSKTLLNRRKLKVFKTNFSVRYCKDCNKLLNFYNSSGYCRMCYPKHRPKTPEYIEKLRNAQLNLVENGLHKGWNSRNIKSYAELFFEKVLNNNKIKYLREKKVGKYFLDFGSFLMNAFISVSPNR